MRAGISGAKFTGFTGPRNLSTQVRQRLREITAQPPVGWLRTISFSGVTFQYARRRPTRSTTAGDHPEHQSVLSGITRPCATDTLLSNERQRQEGSACCHDGRFLY